MRIIRLFIVILFVISIAFTVYIKLSDNADYQAPVISCNLDTITASVNDTDDKLLSYVTANDAKDGDLTDKIIVESVSPFVSKNTAKITYAVCDSENNVAKIEKDIVFYDYSAPEFSFSTQHVYYVGATKVDLLNGVSAYDCLDGDITSRIVISESEINLSEPGIYPVTYKVTTSKGVTSEITINAYVYAGRLNDVISLNSYLVYTDFGKPVDAESFISLLPDKYFNNEDNYYTYDFEIIENVDYKKQGIHYITYRISRTDDNEEFSEPFIIAESYLAVAVRGENK